MSKRNRNKKTNSDNSNVSIASHDPFKTLLGSKAPAVLQESKTVDELIKMAEEMYKQLKTLVKTDEKFLG